MDKEEERIFKSMGRQGVVIRDASEEERSLAQKGFEDRLSSERKQTTDEPAAIHAPTSSALAEGGSNDAVGDARHYDKSAQWDANWRRRKEAEERAAAAEREALARRMADEKARKDAEVAESRQASKMAKVATNEREALAEQRRLMEERLRQKAAAKQQ